MINRTIESEILNKPVADEFWDKERDKVGDKSGNKYWKSGNNCKIS